MILLNIGVILSIIVLLILLICYVCYRNIFYSPKRQPLNVENFELPNGADYEAYRQDMSDWIKLSRKLPHEVFKIKSFDGLTLSAKFYEFEKGAPIEIMFHGYRGSGERDLSGGIERCFKLKRSAFIVDQRASGESEGKIITFGIKERFDCLSWVNFVSNHFGDKVQIILTGISMGAATVLMVSNQGLPQNVKYILADCPYSTPSSIIKNVIADMKLPVKLLFPFVKLSAKIFGGFNLEETSPLNSVENSKKPIILLHGDNDRYVPFNMSEQIYKTCSSVKKLVKIEGAGHGLAYPTNKEKYINSILEFEKEIS